MKLPSKFRPMKPCDLKGSIESLNYPTLATPKLDGIRFVTVFQEDKIIALSNSLKPIRNKLVQMLVNQYTLGGLDGELLLVDRLSKPIKFNLTSSFVMSESKGIKELEDPDSPFYGLRLNAVIFDYWANPSMEYRDRLKQASVLTQEQSKATSRNPYFSLYVLDPVDIYNPDQALNIHQTYQDLGFEGTVFRSPIGRYKFSRSTLREQYSLKLKPFMDSEATVIGTEPWHENLNESTLNERGLKEKSKTLEDRKPLDMLGSLIVDHPVYGHFKIGTGFTHEERKELWNQNLEGLLVKFKYMESGTKDKPRHPVFLGFRSQEDL